MVSCRSRLGPTEEGEEVHQEDHGQDSEVLFPHKSCFGFGGDGKAFACFWGFIAAGFQY